MLWEPIWPAQALPMLLPLSSLLLLRLHLSLAPSSPPSPWLPSMARMQAVSAQRSSEWMLVWLFMCLYVV